MLWEVKFPDAKTALPPPCTPPGTVIARKGFGPLALPYGVLTAATLQRGSGELIAMRKNVKPFSSRKRKRIDKSQGKETRRLRLAASGEKLAHAPAVQSACALSEAYAL